MWLANCATGSHMSSSSLAIVRQQLEEAARVHEQLVNDAGIADQLMQWASWCVQALDAGGTVFFAGNGGSFADAQHLAAELTGKMGRVRPPLAGVALGTNSSSLTAIGNDFSFADVFARELQALASADSVVLALSTSGDSANIVGLVETAASMNLRVMALTGESGGKLRGLCETIRVPSARTERVQEAHILLGHTLCLLIEEEIGFSSERRVKGG